MLKHGEKTLQNEKRIEKAKQYTPAEQKNIATAEQELADAKGPTRAEESGAGLENI